MADEPKWGSDEWQAQNIAGPTGDAARARLAMDPETRRAEYEARKAEAERAKVADLAEFQREATKTEEARLKTAERELEKEKVKKGLAPDAVGGPRTLVGRSLGTVQPRSIQWLWTGWVPKGYITLLAGETGAGKTTVLADITARVTTGTSWPGEFAAEPGELATTPKFIRPPSRVLWLGSEDGIEEMTVPRLMACGANLANVIEIQGVTQQGQRNTFSMQDDLGAVGNWLTFAEQEGNPFAMLVIDPVTSYLPGQKLRKVDLNDAGQLRTVLEPWLILAQKHRIAVVCVTHFAKDTTRSMLHRVLGSAAFAQTCRSLIAVVEPPATEEYEPEPFERAMLQVKVNLPDHPGGSWRFCTEKVEVGTDQVYGTPIYATRPSWMEFDHNLTPKSMIGNTRGPVSKYEAIFGIWLKAKWSSMAPGAWEQVAFVKMNAVAEKAASERWWDDHSGEYLEKVNQNGVWWCRPKGA